MLNLMKMWNFASPTSWNKIRLYFSLFQLTFILFKENENKLNLIYLTKKFFFNGFNFNYVL